MLSSDVLKLHQGRSPFTAQRRATAQGMDPRHARVLQLQREAGNKAVTQMVAAQRRAAQQPAAGQVQVQRAVTTRARDLGKHQLILKGTYGKIIRVLADYEGARAPENEMHYLTMLRALAQTWLGDHARPTSAREKQQREKVELLEAETFREQGVILAQKEYLKGFDAPKDGSGAPAGPRRLSAKSKAPATANRPGGLLPGVAPNGRGYLQSPFDPNQQFGQFEALSMGGRVNAAAPTKSLEMGRAAKGDASEGTDKRAANLARKYKLNAAEIAAIRTYSMPDYAYINPSVANTKDLASDLGRGKDNYLKQLAAQPGGVDTASKEGAMHAGVLMQALMKLPVYAKLSFRGERMSNASFWMRFRKGGTTGGARSDPNKPSADIVYTRFGSASKMRDVAGRYADGDGDVTLRPEQTVSVLMEIEITNARDISALSAALKATAGPQAGKGEEEVLILPGAKFVVQDIAHRPKAEQKAGKAPPATDWYVVKLKQIA